MKPSNKVLAIGPATSIEINETVYRLKSEGRNPITLSYGEAPFQFGGSLNFEKLTLTQVHTILIAEVSYISGKSCATTI